MAGSITRRARISVGGLAATFGLLVATAPASATVACTFDDGSDTLAVTFSANNESAFLQVNSAGTIEVLSGVTCTPGPATVTTIDTINVFDNSASGNTHVTIRQPTTFAPGVTIEQGDPALSEIEFNVSLGAGTADEISADGTSATDNWRFGNSGLNANVGVGADDLEILPIGQPDLWDLSGGDGADTISGRGGNGSGTVFTGAARLDIEGGEGGDMISGGDSATGDQLSGFTGNDTVTGFAGDDEVGGTPGTNVVDGGAGTDIASYRGSNGATVDLGITGPQDTGDGTDTLIDVESAVGSDAADTLIGNAGPNTLDGRDGLDVLDGRGGDDVLADSADGATATYAQAPAGVSVNLNTGTASGGAGDDTLSGIKNLVGSPFADTLIGDAQPQSITGLGGVDTVSALAGADAVDVRDGGPDTATCGSEIDTVTADQASVDTVNADCETTSFLPEAPPADGGGVGEEPPAPGDTELSFDLSGRKKQSVLKQKGVIVTASCPLEACTATATGRGKLPKPKRATRAKLNLKPVTEAVAAGVAEKIKLPLKEKQLKRVKTALAAGKKPKVTVSASASDAAGNLATDALTVKVRR